MQHCTPLAALRVPRAHGPVLAALTAACNVAVPVASMREILGQSTQGCDRTGLLQMLEMFRDAFHRQLCASDLPQPRESSVCVHL